MQITVPVGGTNVVPEGEGPSRHPGDSASTSTLAQRKSLHTVRMVVPQAAQPEYKPEWKENGQLRWVPQEAEAEPVADDVVESTVPRGNGFQDAAPQPYEALQREMAELKQAMQFMAQGQLQQPQQPQGPQAPDPTEFDFYDPHQVKEFHRQNNEYMQAMVQHSVQAALDPHRETMQSAEYTRQYNSVLGDYGHDPNFKPIMERALQMVAKSNGRYSIPEAYDLVASFQITSPHQAASSQNAKPGQRPLTAQEAAQKAAQAQSLPQRNGVSGTADPGLPAFLQRIDKLGEIMLHNQQTGRARPF